MRGLSPLAELDENVFQHGSASLQHIVVPIACDPKPFVRESALSDCVGLRRGVLTPVHFHNETMLEADEIKNVVLKRYLTTKLEFREPAITK